MKRSRKIYMIGLAMLTALFLGSLTASAEVLTVKVKGQYGQTEARSMLAMINEFRTGSDAWYRDEANKTVYATGLQPLVYDYQLEEVAMLRAMEIAVHNDHARPNKTGYASDLVKSNYGGWNAFAENIAAGQTTAKKAFVTWQEADKDYSGQGHRRNMLNSKVTAVGIGHVYYNGYHYWVQLFRTPAGSTSETPANDSETTVDVEVDSSLVTDKSLETSVDSIEIPYGRSAELPKVTGEITTTKSWPGNPCPVELSCEWTSADTGENYIKLDKSQGTITAVGVGTTEITVTALGTTCTVPVTVVRAPIDSDENPAQITLEPEELVYTGAAVKPEVTVVCGERTLEPGTDYDITYEHNIDAGEATVTISAKGNYTGKWTGTFTILPLDLENCAVDEIPDQEYTGSEISPAVTIRHGEEMLIEGTDYSIKYENNTRIGTAAVTIEGTGNYTGTLTKEFAIIPKELGEESSLTIEPEELVYTGAELTPEVTVTCEGKTLDPATDYDIVYEHNVNAGEAAVKVSAKGNYKGELTGTFTILPLNLENCTVGEIPDQEYTGFEITPVVTVKNGEIVLDESDYTVDYGTDNTDVGTVIVTITGRNNCEGVLLAEFEIVPMNLKNCTVDAIPSQEYTGSEIRPAVTVRYEETMLAEGIDYSVEYTNNTDAGTAAVEVKGTGNYTGTLTEEFEITPKELGEESSLTIEQEEVVYTGAELTPEVSVTCEGKTLDPDTDYDIAYEENVNVGEAAVTVLAKGNYKGELTGTFMILPLDLENCIVDEIPDQEYTGSEITPAVTVKNGEIVLDESNYTVDYGTNNTDVGTVTIKITGQDNCEGNLLAAFEIVPLDLKNCTAGAIPSQEYTGSEIRPSVTVRHGRKILTQGTDYSIEYIDNIDAGTAEVVFEGTGNYTGTLTKEFEITPKELGEESGLTIEPEEVVYTGAAVTPGVTVTCEGKTLDPQTDYDVAYEENVNVGEAAVTVSAKGNYAGQLTGTFRILPLNLENCTVDAIPAQEYTGSEIIPAVIVKNGEIRLNESDYTVEFEGKTDVGTVSGTIKGKENCTGELPVTFAIVPFDVGNCTADVILDQVYTGAPISPAVTVRHGQKMLVQGMDYSAEYENNINAGIAVVTIRGQGNYTGTMVRNFVIREPQQNPGTTTPGGQNPGTTTPGEQNPGTSVPEEQNPIKPAEPVLKKGARQKDPATGTVYKVTSSNKAGTPTVEYTVPGNKKKAIVNIPATVTIGNVKCKVTSIANNAFKNNKKLKKVVIGKNVSVIGSNAFRGCTKLSSVTLGAGVVMIKAGAFCNCTALKQLTIPAKVTTIGKQALYGCKKLTRIVIKTQKLTAKSIGKNAFGKLYAKVTVKVPKNKRKAYKKILKGKGLGAKSKIS